MAEEILEDRYERFFRYFDIDIKTIEEAALGGSGVELSNYYTKIQSDVITNTLDVRLQAVEDGADFTNYYTKSQTDTLLANKSNVNHNHDGRYYTSTIIDEMFLNYASENDLNALTGRVVTLEEGTDLSNYYTKSQIDTTFLGYTNSTDLTSLLAGKSDSTHNHDTRYYTKTIMDSMLTSYATVTSLNSLDARVLVLEMDSDLTNYYTKSQTNSTFATITTTDGLDSRIAVLEGSSGPDLTNYYTKSQTDTLFTAYTTTTDLTTLLSGKADETDLAAHVADTSNPHSVTKTQIGLGNVDNTSDSTKNAATVVLTNKDLTSGTNIFPTLNQSTTGNAATATKLATARNINGVAFDGTTNITVADSTKVATTTTVNGHALSSNVTVTATDLSLGNVNNTSDANKPVSTATQTALDAKADLVGGLVPTSQLPAVALTNVQTASSQAAQLALTTQEGDVVVRTDENKTYMRNAGVTGTMTDFTLLNTPADAVTSVNGNTGVVVLGKTDVGLGNVDNTSDATKNAATATLTNKDLTSGTNTFPTFNQATTGNAATATKLITARTINGVSFDGTGNITVADSTKVPTTTTVNGHALSGNVNVTSSDLSLGNVDNTSDVTKNSAVASLTNKDLTAVSNVFPTLNQSTTGNAATATALASARTINGVAFDGTGNITVADSTKVPTTTTVNGHALSGNVTVTATDLSLGNVSNTSDVTKNSAVATLTNKDLTSGTNTFPTFNQSTTGNAATATKLSTARTINGVAFDGTGNITVTDSSAQPLDSDLTTIAGLTATTDSILQSKGSAWTTRTPAQFKTDLVLVKADVGLSSVDNTSDASKPISTLTQAALDLKQPLDSDLTTIAGLTATTDSIIQSKGSAWSVRTPAQFKTDLVLVKADVGLGSVDNTADTAKPVSTAQQTALNLKTDSSTTTALTTRVGALESNTVVALTDGATIATDASLGGIFGVTLGGNRTLSIPTNPSDGMNRTWRLRQDATGTRTITLASGSGGFVLGSQVANTTLTATANKVGYINARYDASYPGGARWCVLAFEPGV